MVLAQLVIMSPVRVSSSSEFSVCIDHPVIISSVRASNSLGFLVCVDTLSLPLSVIVACESYLRARLESG